MFPRPATGAIFRTYKGFLQFNKKKKPCRTTDTNLEFPYRDAQITKAYEVVLKTH